VPSLDDWERQWKKGEMQKPKLVPVEFRGQGIVAPDIGSGVPTEVAKAIGHS
jgi:hypothetical protein